MLEVTSVSVFAKIKAIATGAYSTNKSADRAGKRDSIDDARQKVVDKLIANKDYYVGTTTTHVDCVYKKHADGTYKVGIKYGNRYLVGVFDGQKYVDGIDGQQLVAVLDTLAECTSNGDFDDAIGKIMLANVSVRNNTQH